MAQDRHETVDSASAAAEPYTIYPRSAVVIILIAAGLAFQNYVQHNILQTEIVRAKEQIMQTATSEWLSQGMKTTVTTTRMTGETNAEFAARHRSAVDEMLKIFPKDT